MKFKVSL